MEPVAFWQRWWSGHRDKDRKYHSNEVWLNLGGIDIAGGHDISMCGKGPVETKPGQWTEIVALFEVRGISHGG